MTTQPKKRQKKSNLSLKIVAVLGFLFVSFSYYAYQIVYTGNVDTKGSRAYIRIPKGATFEQVMDSINKENVIVDKLSFRFLAKLMDYPKLIKPGHYELKNGATNYQLISDLRAGRQSPVKLTFTNVRLKKDLTKKLSQDISASQTELDSLLSSEKYVKSLGFDTTTIMTMFIPNTYEMYWNTSAEELMKRMKKEYDAFWTQEREAKAQKLGLSKADVSTLASIVQAEQEQHADERRRIAGVYLNRLRIGMPLQADPTVKYAVGDFGIRRVLNVHLQKDSPYNTYKYKGLPPGPINLPSINAIDAVLNPEKNNYIYFCAKEDFSGYHAFAATEAEHLQNARRYQAALTQRNIMK
ncbi:endolytic transglycosylase MltG [Adhaeribacter aquaticus]|uniref:endolytic transglycosylase MltG n=1 Tax=Adhaeribacter aquaticus TaxID=299567 RepID=UPI0003F5B03D|nr:endolytic transglycosylase MltG [Adhaeribacter aquaticus]